MKKISALLLTIAACLAFTSCKRKTTKKATTKGKTTTKAVTTTAPAPQPGTKTITSKTYEQIIALIGDKFAIDVDIPNKEDGDSDYELINAYLAYSPDKVCLKQEGSGVMYIVKKNSDTYTMYTHDSASDLYDSLYYIPKEYIDYYTIDPEDALAIACELTIKYQTTETVSFLNRTCTQYNNSYTENNKNITEIYVIDNATGLCLKHSITSGTAIINEKTFEVKSIILGDDVDDEFASEDTKIYVSEWDTSFMGNHGFAEGESHHFDIADIYSAYTGTKPTYQFIQADTKYYDGHPYEHMTAIEFAGNPKDAGNFALEIAHELYACGAYYDKNGNASEFDKIVKVEKDTDDTDLILDITFNGFAGTGMINKFRLTYQYTEESDTLVLTITITDTEKDPRPKTYTTDSLEDVLKAFNGRVVLEVKLPDRDDDAWEYSNSALAIWDSSTNKRFYIANSYGAYYFKEYPGKSDKLYLYMKYDGNGYDAVYGVDIKSAEDFIDIEEALSIACGLDITYTNKETDVTYINRTCTKYTNTTTEGSATITETWIVDNVTGICLSHTIQSSATPDVPTINETTFEVTKFLLSDAVENYFATQDMYIYVTPWSAYYMSQIGFGDESEEAGFYYSLDQLYENYDGTKPTYYYSYGIAHINGTHTYELDTAVILEGATDKVKGQFATRVVTDLFKAGAKYNGNGQQVALDDLVTIITDPNDTTIVTGITFVAYTDANQENRVFYSYELNHKADPDDAEELPTTVISLELKAFPWFPSN